MNRRISLALVALATSSVAFVATPAHAVYTVQPGSSIESDGSYCTLNWIYTGTGAGNLGTVYGGTAAHCVTSVGQAVYLATGSLGVRLVKIGNVAFISGALDYALIGLDTATVAVSPAMKGHPEIPTGVSTASSSQLGDLIQFSGNGVGFHATQPTRELRVGVLAFNDGTQHYVDGPVSPGDSGGPVADISDGNKALGIVNTLGVAIGGSFGATVGEGGVSLPGMFADAAANNVPIALRTV